MRETSQQQRRISVLRQRLVDARKAGDRAVVGEIEASVNTLAKDQYRCCLLDFESCSRAFYVRVLGFENGRIKAALEFPIEPQLSAVQWIPLSHMADCDEAQDEYDIRNIYDGMASFVHHKTAGLQREFDSYAIAANQDPTCCNAEPSCRGLAVVSESSRLKRRDRPSFGFGSIARSRHALINAIGWWVAGILFSSSLVLVVM